jgi:hypothetical protein
MVLLKAEADEAPTGERKAASSEEICDPRPETNSGRRAQE